MHSPPRFLSAAVLLCAAFLVPNALYAQNQATLPRARQLLQQGDLDGARKLLQELSQSQPVNGRVWYLLGYSLHGLGRLEEAVAAHEKAATFPLVAPNACYNAACAHALLGHNDQAFLWLQRARDAGAPLQAVGTDTDLDSLRTDPRLAEFMPTPLDQLPPLAEASVKILQQSFGGAANDQYGWVARRVGDVDGDGYQDYASTAPTAANSQGYVVVYSGHSGDRLFHWSGGATGHLFGWIVAGAGDQDQDGHADVLVGSPGAGTGQVTLYSGIDGSVLRVFQGEQPGSKFGQDLNQIGDLDGDGAPELLIGAPQFSTAASGDGSGAAGGGGGAAGGNAAGRAYLYAGGAEGALLRTFDGAPGDTLGESAAGWFQNGNGVIALAAPHPQQPTQGKMLFLDPRDGKELFRYNAPPTAVNVGWFLSVVGDVNADGIPDFFHTDWQDAAKGNTTGRATVTSGTDGSTLQEHLGAYAGEGYGIGLGDAGDMDGDGFDDLAIGAWQNRDQVASGGKIYLYSGRDGQLIGAFTGAIAGATLGFDSTQIGDVDDDQVPDLLVTAAWDPVHGFQSGRTLVVSGATALNAPVRTAAVGAIDPRGLWFHAFTGSTAGAEWSLIQSAGNEPGLYQLSDFGGQGYRFRLGSDGRVEVLGDAEGSEAGIDVSNAGSGSGSGRFDGPDQARIDSRFPQMVGYHSLLSRAPGTAADFPMELGQRQAGDATLNGTWSARWRSLSPVSGTILHQEEREIEVVVETDTLRLQWNDSVWYQGVWAGPALAVFRVHTPGLNGGASLSLQGSELSEGLDMIGVARVVDPQHIQVQLFLQTRDGFGRQRQEMLGLDLHRKMP